MAFQFCVPKRSADINRGARPPATPTARLIYRVLEPRVVFDAAALATLDHATTSDPGQTTSETSDMEHALAAMLSPPVSVDAGETRDVITSEPAVSGSEVMGGEAEAETTPNDPTAHLPVADPARSVVFVDERVADAAVLASAVAPGTDIIRISETSDGVTQIAAHLADRHDLMSIHILAHGSAGSLQLGSVAVTTETMTAHAVEFAAMGSALAAGGDILIYGCDVGAGERGAQFVEQLADLTDRDVAASDDTTGASDLGGDWILERTSGDIEAQSITAADWTHTLAPVSISAQPDSLVVRDGTGAVVASGTSGFSDGRTTANLGLNATASWTNVGSVGGVAVDLRATVVDIGAGDTIKFDQQVAGNDNPGLALTDGGADNASVRIK